MYEKSCIGIEILHMKIQKKNCVIALMNYQNEK